MGWEDDNEEDLSLSRDRWSTWDKAWNYDDDKGQIIRVMKKSEYNEMKRRWH